LEHIAGGAAIIRQPCAAINPAMQHFLTEPFGSILI
jgi:hypothetical protein